MGPYQEHLAMSNGVWFFSKRVHTQNIWLRVMGFASSLNGSIPRTFVQLQQLKKSQFIRHYFEWLNTC